MCGIALAQGPIAAVPTGTKDLVGVYGPAQVQVATLNSLGTSVSSFRLVSCAATVALLLWCGSRGDAQQPTPKDLASNPAVRGPNLGLVANQKRFRPGIRCCPF